MQSYILMQPDGKFAIFSAITDDFTNFGMTSTEALAWGVKTWGKKIAGEHFAKAVADEPVGVSGQPSNDGLGRWRSSLTDIAAAYGLNYLQTALIEIGFGGAAIPQSAINAVNNSGQGAAIFNLVQMKLLKKPAGNIDRSKLSAHLLKLSLGLREDDKPKN